MIKLIFKILGTLAFIFALFVGSVFVFPELYLSGSDLKEFQSDRKFIFKATRKLFFSKSCENPLVYSISDIDERFGVKKSEVLAIVLEAEKVWEQAVDKDLFKYEADADKDITIDFIYGKEQARTTAEIVSSNQIDADWARYKVLQKQYNALANSYETSAAQYSKELTQNNADIQKFNQRVHDWKKNPGSDAEYDNLKSEEQRLAAASARLKAVAAELNQITLALNSQQMQLEALWEKYSAATDAHNTKFATGEIVEQAVFDGMFAIKIYTYKSKEDLRATLAHEMGHALGIDHLSQKKSLMYYLKNPEQETESLKLSDEDKQALVAVCGLDK